jgi:hypothetical protein
VWTPYISDNRQGRRVGGKERTRFPAGMISSRHVKKQGVAREIFTAEELPASERYISGLSHVYLTLHEDLEGCNKKLRRGTLLEDMSTTNKSTVTVTWNKKVCHLNLSGLLT